VPANPPDGCTGTGKGLLEQLDEQAGDPLTGLQGHITDKTITHNHVRHIPEQITALNIADIVQCFTLREHM
jgi:hypothetical protein